MDGDEQRLTTWGTGAHASSAARQDDVVLKDAGPWAPTVLALLRHLERAGFDGAPRVVGDGIAPDGRLTLTYVPGGSVHPRAWPPDECRAVGALLRRAHEAAESFEAPADAAWGRSWLHEIGDEDDLVIGHGDAAPWNIVGLDRRPQALIDWDTAGPIERLTEVAYAVWLNAQLHDDDIAAAQALPPAYVRARQARNIVDGYGLNRPQRLVLVDRMVEVALAGVRADAEENDVGPESDAAVTASGYPVLWSVTWRARSAGWMFRNRRMLTDALVVR
ncbi:phosphotransferase [Nocardioides marinquilinus]|uniref:Phosphotransferase n=1 Tax=Nocardioides marinquilinus TaxID=1210400 RepID=A0ABP9P614_9ACTN